MASDDAPVEIVPGEMRLWTDLGNDLRPAAGGPALTALLGQLPREGSVLVLGPHGDDVLGLLGEATLVVRSLSDAEEYAGRHPSLRVVCGDLVEVAGSYDLVVALDGLERLGSNDRPPIAFADRLAHVAGLVAPGGRLLLAVDNDASALGLADARPLAERRETGDWEPPVSTDPTRPAGQLAAVAALAAHGLAGTAFAAAWRPGAPSVLVDVDAPADDVRIRAVLGDPAPLAAYSLLLDPTVPALLALRAGRFADAATGWVLVAGRDAAPVELPAAVLDTGAADVTLVRAADLAEPPGATSVVEAAVTLAQREDVAGLRALMRDFLPWTAKESHARRPTEVVLTDAGFAPLPGPRLEGDPVAVAALWLARRLLAPDMRRIWPAWLHEHDVARSLAAMAGLEIAEDDLADLDVPGPAPVTADVRTLRAMNDQLREELVAARGEIYAHERLATTRDRQLERRSVNVAKAEARAEAAERRVRELEEELRRIDSAVTRRAARAVRDPKKVARKVQQRLKR